MGWRGLYQQFSQPARRAISSRHLRCGAARDAKIGRRAPATRCLRSAGAALRRGAAARRCGARRDFQPARMAWPLGPGCGTPTRPVPLLVRCPYQVSLPYRTHVSLPYRAVQHQRLAYPTVQYRCGGTGGLLCIKLIIRHHGSTHRCESETVRMFGWQQHSTVQVLPHLGQVFLPRENRPGFDYSHGQGAPLPHSWGRFL